MPKCGMFSCFFTMHEKKRGKEGNLYFITFKVVKKSNLPGTKNKKINNSEYIRY